MENKSQSVEESSKLLISVSVSFGIMILSIGGFVLLLSRAGCF